MSTQRETTSSSNLHRRRACRASHVLEHGLPASEDSDVSLMGTIGHDLFANKDKSRAHLKPDLIRALDNADYEQSRLIGMVEADCGIPDGADFEEGYEETLHFVSVFGEKLFPGHCDYWRFYPGPRVLIIADLKLGFIPVDAAEFNDQVTSYGCMFRHKTACDVFYGALIQPRQDIEDRLTVARYDGNQIDAAAVDFEKLWAEINSVPADERAHDYATAGADQCRYCRAKLRCRAFLKYITDLIPGIPPPVARATAGAAMKPLDAAKFSYVGEAIKFADMIRDGWKEEAIDRIEAGELPDWVIQEGKTRRNVVDLTKAFEILEREIGDAFTADVFMSACKLSIPELVDPIAKMTAKPKTKTKALLLDVLAPVIEEKQDAPSVVRA